MPSQSQLLLNVPASLQVQSSAIVSGGKMFVECVGEIAMQLLNITLSNSIVPKT